MSLILGATPLGTPELLTTRQRVRATAGGLILSWRDRPHLLWEIYFMGERNFIGVMRRAEADQVAAVAAAHDPADVAPSINQNMTDAEYGEVYEAVVEYVKTLAKKGAAWRKRKDSRG